jgi:hypothetical protein
MPKESPLEYLAEHGKERLDNREDVLVVDDKNGYQSCEVK